MCTAYGTGLDSYTVWWPYNVKLYSFEFNNLVSSYTTDYKNYRNGNRESVKVELGHSLVLAKHLGVAKLQAVRQYYDHYHVLLGSISENAFKFLQKQTKCSFPDDATIWMMFRSVHFKIPLFSYQMQAVALWEDETNWRALQASAHQDIWSSLMCAEYLEIENKGKALHNAQHGGNILEYWTRWSKQRIPWNCSLGVVIETVRTFLAEWIAENAMDLVWEQEVPNECFEFDLDGASIVLETVENDTLHLTPRRLIWI